MPSGVRIHGAIPAAPKGHASVIVQRTPYLGVFSLRLVQDVTIEHLRLGATTGRNGLHRDGKGKASLLIQAYGSNRVELRNNYLVQAFAGIALVDNFDVDKPIRPDGGCEIGFNNRNFIIEDNILQGSGSLSDHDARGITLRRSGLSVSSIACSQRSLS